MWDCIAGELIYRMCRGHKPPMLNLLISLCRRGDDKSPNSCCASLPIISAIICDMIKSDSVCLFPAMWVDGVSQFSRHGAAKQPSFFISSAWSIIRKDAGQITSVPKYMSIEIKSAYGHDACIHWQDLFQANAEGTCHSFAL